MPSVRDARPEQLMLTIRAAIAQFDSDMIREAIEARGYWVSPTLLDAPTCAQIGQLYDDETVAFRATIDMARHGFGNGEYKYFAHPLPPIVTTLRGAIYEKLAPIANQWNRCSHDPSEWPACHDELVKLCAKAGQRQPTPLLLRYSAGDYNCLHQDLYGKVHFPLQAIVLLDRPDLDFEGGELLLVEQRPRRQSRASVVPISQGALAVIPVKERVVASVRGTARMQVRHGVAEVRRGQRRTLGLIFHDAA
jgi:hypothetical protein